MGRDNQETDNFASLKAADPATEVRVADHLDDGGSERIEAEARSRAALPGEDRTPARYRRRVGIAAVAMAGAFTLLLVIVGTGTDESRTGGPPSGPLASFAALASEQQRLAPFEFIDWEYEWKSPRGIDRKLKIWAGSDERYEERSFDVDGASEGRDRIYLDRGSGLSCTASGRAKVPRCEPFDPVPGSPAGRDPWVELWFEAPELPTNSARLRADLEGQIRREYEAGINSGTPTTGPVDGVSGFGPTGPFEELEPRFQQAIYVEELFAKLVALLSNPYAPPELRGAAFELLGSLEGVEVRRGAQTSDRRAAVRISFDRPFPGPKPPPGLEIYDLYIDPDTSQVLELHIKRRGDGGERLVAIERVLKRRAVENLPIEAISLREAARSYEPPAPEPDPEPLPEATEAPPVLLSSGPNWEFVITYDRSLEMRLNGSASVQRTSGYTLPPTLREAGSFPTGDASQGQSDDVAKIVAGPLPDAVASVSIETSSGQVLEAGLEDAFDLRWFWAELGKGERPAVITARDGDDETVTERARRR